MGGRGHDVPLHERAHSFQVRVVKTVTTFRPTKEEIGCHFVALGKNARVLCLSNPDFLDVAHEHFGTSQWAKSSPASLVEQRPKREMVWFRQLPQKLAEAVLSE